MDLVQTIPSGVFPLAYLPPEILHMVFSQFDENQDLTAVSRVCKLFFGILTDPSFHLHEKMFRNGRGHVFIGGGLNVPILVGYDQTNRKFPPVFIRGKEVHAAGRFRVSRWEWDGSNGSCRSMCNESFPEAPLTIPSNFTKEARIACLRMEDLISDAPQIQIFDNGTVSTQFSKEEQGAYDFKQLSLQEGFLAALGSKDGADHLIVFSLPSKEVLHKIPFEKAALWICSDQKSVVVYFKEIEGQSEKGKIAVLNIASGKVKESFLSFEVSGNHVYLDEGKIIAATVNGKIASIDVETGEERRLNRWKFEGDRTWVAQMVISNHKAALFSNNGDFFNNIEVYDLKKWEPFACFPAVSEYTLLGIVFQNHLLAAFGMKSGPFTLKDQIATIWYPFLPQKNLSLRENKTKPFFPASQKSLETKYLTSFTDVTRKIEEIIDDDSQSFLDEHDALEEIDDSKEQPVLTVSTGNTQESKPLETEVPVSKDLPLPEPQANVEAEASCCSCFYGLYACFKWLFCKIFSFGQVE